MSKFLSPNKSRVFVFCAILITSILFFAPSLFSVLRISTLRVMMVPVKLCSTIEKHFSSKHDLFEENKDLRKDLGALILDIERLKDLREENERLRDLLSFREKIDYDTVSAEVVARNPNDWAGTFIVDRGTADGIKRNSAVCATKGLLGKVVEADANCSSVMMMTHPGFKVGGVVNGTRINGIVVGAGKGTAKMLYIPVDADVRKGTVVVTSDFSRIFPKGITIGEIVSVGKSRTGLYQYAIIKPSADLFDQEEVLCVK